MSTPPRPAIGLIKLLALLALPAAALAQSVTVSVNAGTVIRTVDERIFGINSVIWDPQASSDQTISLVQAAGLRTIRVPGGSLSDEYHWRTNTSLANTWTWSTSFNGFGKLITGAGVQTFVTVNYGTGTPEEAAALVAYANAATGSAVNIGADAKTYNWQTAGTWAGLRAASALATDDGMNFLRVGRSTAYGFKYWEVGNENYGTWEADEQAVKNDAYTYASRAKTYIDKMKAVDPTIRIGVVVTARDDDYVNGHTSHPATNLRTNTTANGWTPVVLGTLRSLNVTPDFIIYHRYEQAPSSDQPNNPETDAGLLQKAKTWPDDVANMRRMLTDYLGATEAAKVEIVVTENNSVYANPGKQSTSLVNGLYLADSVGNLLQTEINALMWWDLRNGPPNSNGVITGNMSSSLYGWRNYGDYGVLSTPYSGGATGYYEAYPTYYALKLLSKFARQGDTVVSATSNNSLLSVFAVKTTGGNLNLLVINKSPPTTPTTTLTANIALSGHTAPAAANVYSYGIPQDDAAKTGVTDLASTTMAITGGTFTASFAPYSMTVISLDPTATPPAPVVTPPPVTPPPITPPPSSGGGGGGGGGGAPSLWLVGALGLLALARKIIRR